MKTNSLKTPAQNHGRWNQTISVQHNLQKFDNTLLQDKELLLYWR